jgi:D-glutamate cyclase
MSDPRLTAIRDLIQEDIGSRGLGSDPVSNLITAFPDDFEAACRSLAATPEVGLAIVTGFFIPTADPPAGETDGPLGAIFLARALVPLGVRVILLTDVFCFNALRAGLMASGLERIVELATLPPRTHPWDVYLQLDWQRGLQGHFPLTHLLAIERVGPSHTPASVAAQPGATEETTSLFQAEVPAEDHDRCHTMRGRDITEQMSPAHLLFEHEARERRGLTTIGIGDGGNEIGMGKLPWEVIRRNIPGGARVACRTATDHLIVCGISNWGAYGLAAGVRLLRGHGPSAELFDVETEREVLRIMVEAGPLVDGVLGRPSMSVDGMSFDRYVEPLRRLAQVR